MKNTCNKNEKGTNISEDNTKKNKEDEINNDIEHYDQNSVSRKKSERSEKESDHTDKIWIYENGRQM